ncbi:MAG: hypothetical protein KGQ60_00365, partial [Planctomycetes bacterium]|nr:hypothetical protein [Planctomycetota bacterium]
VVGVGDGLFDGMYQGMCNMGNFIDCRINVKAAKMKFGHQGVLPVHYLKKDLIGVVASGCTVNMKRCLMEPASKGTFLGSIQQNGFCIITTHDTFGYRRNGKVVLLCLGIPVFGERWIGPTAQAHGGVTGLNGSYGHSIGPISGDIRLMESRLDGLVAETQCWKPCGVVGRDRIGGVKVIQ